MSNFMPLCGPKSVLFLVLCLQVVTIRIFLCFLLGTVLYTDIQSIYVPIYIISKYLNRETIIDSHGCHCENRLIVTVKVKFQPSNSAIQQNYIRIRFKKITKLYYKKIMTIE